MARDFFDYTRSDLEGFLASRQKSAMHARHLFQNAYKSQSLEPWADDRLPRALSQEFAAGFEALPLKAIVERLSAYDRSVKFLFSLRDGSQVETVLMPESQRITLCISTQVGCQQGCVFCHTGRMGLIRNLTTGEIVAQVVSVNRWLAEHPEWLQKARLGSDLRVTNIVFMGMGEPLDNVHAVISAIKIMIDSYGLGLGPRHISVSTAGHLDGLKILLSALSNVRLAISVHSTNNVKRSKIMPINRVWPLEQVLQYLREKIGSSRPVLLQYTMIAGVNDNLEEAEQLVRLTQGLDAKVNLIPLNEVGVSRLRVSSPEAIQVFRDVLHKNGLRTMVRYSKGQDIAAACGQLVSGARVAETN
jgi:23S rRNA (adenine2503-C2)-methyltransferase